MDRFLIFVETKSVKTIKELQNLIAKRLKLPAGHLSIKGYKLLLEDYVQDIIDDNEIEYSFNEQVEPQINKKVKLNNLDASQKKQPIQPSSSSESEIVPVPQKVVQSAKAQLMKPNLTKTVQQKKIVPSSSESDSDSYLEVQQKKFTVQKPNPNNKLNLSFKAPEQDMAEKQLQWKEVFKASSLNKQPISQQPIQQQQQRKNPVQQDKQPKQQQQQQQQQQQTTTVLQNYQKVSIEKLKQDPNILQEHDIVQFKYSFFNVEKCQPCVSDLIKGKVILNNYESTRIAIHILKKNEKLELFYSEIIDLEVDISQMSKERQQAITATSPSIATTVQPEVIVKEEVKKNNDNWDMIGKQVNFYYSDRNYKKDDFIQQHSAQHPQKYMALKLLLNFPKIKRVLQNEEKLKEIMDDFAAKTKPEELNYEIHTLEDGTLGIRKKGL